MTTRLLTIISGSPLPNFIAINELRPDVVHCIYTPGIGDMDSRLATLKEVFKPIYTDLVFESMGVKDITESKAIALLAKKLLDRYPNDDWLLNRTAGAEQMRAPLMAEFDSRNQASIRLQDKQFRTFYVETDKNRLTFNLPDWAIEPQPFKLDISVEVYFKLFGETLEQSVKPNLNQSEADLIASLGQLSFYKIMHSMLWKDNESLTLAEFDVLATYKYKLFAFERKNMVNIDKAKMIAADKIKKINASRSASVQHDIEKLAYLRSMFAQFGQVYWILSGGYQVSETHQSRAKRLKLHFIEVVKDQNILPFWKQYNLPPPKE